MPTSEAQRYPSFLLPPLHFVEFLRPIALSRRLRFLAERAEKGGRRLQKRAAKLKARQHNEEEEGAASAQAPPAAAAAAPAAAAPAAAAPANKSGKSRNLPANHPDFDRSRHGITVLEALAASGLRSLRYYREIDTVRSILCNDFSPDAVASIRRNVEFAGLDANTQIVPHHGDASAIMHACAAASAVASPPPTVVSTTVGGTAPAPSHGANADADAKADAEKSADSLSATARLLRQPFDVIDLDPYGTAAPFLDGAVRAVADGGLLCVTCTDMAVLAGAHSEACFARYGIMPLRAAYSHEMALRVLHGTLATLATRYGRYTVPLLSCSIDYYVRVFVRVFDGANEAKRAAAKTRYVLQCTGCQTFHTFPAGRIQETEKGPKYKAGAGPRCGPNCDR